MRIGVDFDECIYPFVMTWRAYAGCEVRPADTWAFYEEDGYSLAEYLKVFEEGVDAGIIFAKGEPLPGSVDTLTALKRDGHSIHIVTDRFVGACSFGNTEVWLSENPLPYDTLTFAKDKTVVRARAFIDDKPSNVDALREAGCHAFLLDTGRDDQRGHRWLVRDWAEFYSEVAAL